MDQSLKQFFAPIVKPIKQYNMTIMIVVIAVLLSLAVFRLYQIVNVTFQKGVEGYSSASKAGGAFDQQTIEKVRDLKTPDQAAAPLQLPTRQSPFVE